MTIFGIYFHPVLFLFAGLLIDAMILAGPTLYDDWKKSHHRR